MISLWTSVELSTELHHESCTITVQDLDPRKLRKSVPHCISDPQSNDPNDEDAKGPHGDLDTGEHRGDEAKESTSDDRCDRHHDDPDPGGGVGGETQCSEDAEERHSTACNLNRAVGS